MANKYTYLICSLITLFANGCMYKEDLVPVDDIIVSLTPVQKAISADGVSRSRILVELAKNTTDTKRSVILTTTKGLFEIEGKSTLTVTAVDTNINGEMKTVATASLISANEEGSAVVTAKVLHFLKTTTVDFTRSYPEYLQVSVDKLNYKPDLNAEIVITVQLKRNAGNGKPSPGQTITLEILDVNGYPIGKLRNKSLVTDQDGKCVNYLSISATPVYTGPVKISARAFKDNTNSTTDSATITVTQ